MSHEMTWQGRSANWQPQRLLSCCHHRRRKTCMAELVRLARHDDIAVLTIDNPPVNALGPGVAEGIEALLREAAEDPRVRAIVVIGAGQTFIAGADIREFAKI